MIRPFLRTHPQNIDGRPIFLNVLERFERQPFQFFELAWLTEDSGSAEQRQPEAKASIQKILKEEATEQNIGLVYKLTGGRFRNLEFFQPRYVELRELNKEKLKRGEVQTGEVIKMAAARLIIG